MRYDLRSGVIEFSEDATITEGGNQISSNYLIYNIVEQRINAQGSPDGDGKVRIIYTPQSTSDDASEGSVEEPDDGDPEQNAGDSDP